LHDKQDKTRQDKTRQQATMVLDRFFGNNSTTRSPPSSFEKLDKDHHQNDTRRNDDDDVDDFFGRFFVGQPAEMSRMMERLRRQQHAHSGIKVDETEDMFRVSMDVPGVKRDEMTVKLENSMICINGNRTFHQQGKNHNHTSTSRFHQCFSANSYLDTSKATADLSNGVLVVSAPKLEQKAAVEVPIVEGGRSRL
jgi:HSP20 family protein